MWNPLRNLLTGAEQKALLFVLGAFVLGFALHQFGWTAPQAQRQALGVQELAAAVKTDVPVQIDIRTAPKEELILLPGIGEKRALDIIAYREQKQFENVNELLQIKGIGPKTYEKMKPMLLLFGESETPSEATPASTAKAADSGTKTTTRKSDLTALVNINTAGLDELCTLPGIGPVKAQAIIDYRTQNGPFQSIEDIVKVKGIGAKTLEKIRHRLSI